MACFLTRARMVSVCSAVTESYNSDKSEVIAARPECLPITMRWERPSNPGSSAWIGGPVFYEPIDVDAGFMGKDMLADNRLVERNGAARCGCSGGREFFQFG